LKARISELGGTVLAGSPDEFRNLIASETENWAKVIKFAGIGCGWTCFNSGHHGQGGDVTSIATRPTLPSITKSNRLCSDC
jgi:hypothetical protein